MKIIGLITLLLLQILAFGQRTVISLDGEWKFCLDSLNKGEAQGWSQHGLPATAVNVKVPHTWNTMPGLENKWGKGWYEKTISIPSSYAGKIIRLQFEAVYHDATIWINGKQAAVHNGLGYTRFFVDATPFLKFGAINTVIVCADNSSSSTSLPYKKSYDWAHDGGIYRSVAMVVTNLQSIENVMVTAKPDLVTKDRGQIKLDISFLGNAYSYPENCSLQIDIKEENQKTTHIISSKKFVSVIKDGKTSVSFPVKNIKLWHFDAPNLYRANIKLISRGKMKDTYSTTFGFRTIAVNSTRFILNGEPVRLAGLEWMPGSSLKNGMAETHQELEQNLILMKGINCIYTRFHWPQDDYVFDWADRHGILIQEEIPCWGGATRFNDTIIGVAKKFLDEMMAAHYNHPSLITWGIGNELSSHTPLVINAMRELYNYAKQKDSSRLINYVSNQLQNRTNGKDAVLPDASALGDALMFNEYTATWYHKSMNEVIPSLEGIHEDYPAKPLVISEFGLCEPIFKGGDTRRAKDAKFQFTTYSNQPYVAGAIYFCLNDYRTHMGEDHTYSYPQRVHGVVDIHLKLKPSYDTVKMLCSPIEIVSVERKGNKIHVQLNGKTGLPSYTLKGYKLEAGKASITIPDLKPGNTIDIELPFSADVHKVSVIRPTGYVVTENIDSFTQKIDIPENIPITHPRIYTDYNAQQQLKNKLQKAPWAKDIVENIKQRLEPYMARFAKDPNWMASRLQMYWKSHHTDIYIKGNYFVKAEGKAPVPTVRYAGTRDWATIYKAPSLEDVIPYSDEANGTIYVLNGGNKGEWIAPEKTGFIIEKINEQILSYAQDAAFLYWYTGEESYARFASTIFTTYVTGLYYLNPPITTEDDPEGRISGLTSFEVIHEAVIIPTTICYDFLFNYIRKTNPHFVMEMVAPVFKKWADNIIAKGVPDNNWNILEARYLSYLSMSLENNNAYPDGKGASYYLDVIYNQNSVRQAGLTESIKGFDSNTGIWNESPGYSVNVSADFLKIALLTDRVMPNSLKLMMPVLKKAVSSSAQYLMPDGFAVSWGDSHYYELPAASAEYLIAWSRKYHNKEDEESFTRQLKFTQDASYDRGGQKSLFELFFYVDKLMDTKPSTLQDFASTTFYAPNVSWFVQRNGFSKQNGLMISSNGSLGNHSHANGISIELYGKGYPLAPDFAAGSSYWQQDHHEFYSQFAAHNTVVVDGKSSYPVMKGNNAFILKSFYPASKQKECFFKAITFSNLAFTEPSTQASQLRLLSIIRTSDSTGYYVDIFRSKKKDGGDVKHEYLYHNMAQTVWLTDARSNPLILKPTDELSAANGDVVGYNYFTDKSVVDYTGAFTGRFELKVDKKEPVQMNLWMAGDSARRIFLVKSPVSRALTNKLVPAEIALLKVPTLVLRQPGEAWTHPFAAIIEPSYANKQSIAEIKSFKASSKNDEFVGLEVDGKDSSRQYIFSDVSGTKINMYQGFEFTGTYAVASQKAGQLQYLFLGNGKTFSKDGYGMIAKDSVLTAALSMENGTWKLYAEESLTLKLPFNGKNSTVILQTENNKGEKKEYSGVISHFGKIEQAVFDLPALPDQWLKIKLKSN